MTAVEDMYRELFERSADAILIIDGETFVDCNQATVDMLRYRDKAELLQTHPSELSPERQPDGRPSFEKANEMIASAFAHGSHRFEWDHMRADGEVFPVEVLLTAVRAGSRQLLHVVWRDITERRRLEEELRHAQKMEALGKLAGGIAHDFNNLLVAMIGYAELLRRELVDPELRGHLREIRLAADRAAALTRQLLTFSRKQVLHPDVVDVAARLVQLQELLARVVGEDVELVVTLGSAPLPVLIDPGQLEQVVLNLVANARDALTGVGQIRLALEPADGGVRLTVADTGPGMSPEVRARAFEPFFTTKQPGRGTGLGLSTVYGIVTQAGGWIRLDSEPGAGTTVDVWLPLTARAPQRPTSDPHIPGPLLAGTVLVVEDEPAVSGLTRRVLVRSGLNVIEARDGAEALEVAADAEIQLLLTDVVMPRMGGAELARRLLDVRPELKVLFMSGYTDNALVEHGYDPAAIDLLRKPFTPESLLARVRAALDA